MSATADRRACAGPPSSRSCSAAPSGSEGGGRGRRPIHGSSRAGAGTVTIMICRDCGERVKVRSFEACCTECGSEDLEPEDAYDPVEHELQCQFCGYQIDTTTGPDKDWADDTADNTPTSVDDPCRSATARWCPAARRAASVTSLVQARQRSRPQATPRPRHPRSTIRARAFSRRSRPGAHHRQLRPRRPVGGHPHRDPDGRV